MSRLLDKEVCQARLISSDGVEIAFTQNRTELDHYFIVREICYRSVSGGPTNFDGSEDELDRISDVLVVKHQGKIVGGARLVASTPDHRTLLPTEQEDFQMKDVFPDLKLKERRYCEFGRIALLEEYRGIKILEKICGALILKAIRLNYEYQFSMAPAITSRVYRKVSKNLKLPYPYTIHTGIQVPEKPNEITGGLKMYLGSLRLPASTACLAFNHISDRVQPLLKAA